MVLKKNIALVVTSLQSGGLERNASLLANHFSSLGHNVYIYCLYSTNCFFELNESVKLIDLSTKKRKIFSILSWINGIHKQNKKLDIDTIISFGERVGIVTGLAKNKNINHICRGVNTRKKKRINRFLMLLIKNKFSKIVFQTNAQKNIYPKLIQNKGIVINNPFVLQNRNLNEAGVLSKRFVMVATFKIKQKRQDIAIKAFSKFHMTHPEYEFDFYGKCDETENNLIDKLIKENNLSNFVHLKGETNDVLSCIVPSRAFICSSMHEGMPNALIEALSYGIPVISTKWLGYDEILTERTNSLLCELESIDELAKKMSEIADDDELFLRLNEKCYSYNLSMFESEYIFKKWDNII